MMEFKVQELYDFVMKAERFNRSCCISKDFDTYQYYCYALKKEHTYEFTNENMDNVLYNLVSRDNKCHYVVDIFSNKINYKMLYFDKKQIENNINLDYYDSESIEEFAFQLSVAYDFPFSTEDYILILKIVNKLRENERNINENYQG